MDPTFIKRVVLRNYKSIAACSVGLRPLTFLVGPNGSGKSNFLDALRLVADALRTSLDHALRERGGIKEVRRRSGGHPTHFGIRLEFTLHDGTSGAYSFKVSARQSGGYEVQSEECTLSHSRALQEESSYTVRTGEVVRASAPVYPPASADRLYLVNAAGLPEFRPVYEALSRMGFYNLNPSVIRDLQPPDAGELLARDGSNIASVLANLADASPVTKARIEEFLAKVVPGVLGVDQKTIGPKETLEFRQAIAGSRDPWRFHAANMSDGTLRSLGILLALFQLQNGKQPPVPLVGIEEPEMALHPAAAGVLLDALRDAALSRQVLVTSHSPDLLNDAGIDTDSILSVISDDGTTQIGPIGEAERSALSDRLYTAGELLRLNQLTPDLEHIRNTPASQLRLFETDPD